VSISAVDLSTVLAPRTTSANTSGGSGFSEVLADAFYAGQTGYDSCFAAAAEQYGLPVSLLKAVGRAESGFQADVVSPCGAQGIMQLMPSTARALGVSNAFDPQQNIMGGAKFLRQMLDRFNGDVSLALAAYNAGPGAVSKYGGVPPYKETQNYVAKVQRYAGEFANGTASVHAASAPKKSVTSSVEAADLPQAGQMPSVQQLTAALGADETLAASIDQLSGKELAGIVHDVFQSGGTLDQDAVRMLIQQMLAKKLEEEEQADPGLVL